MTNEVTTMAATTPLLNLGAMSPAIQIMLDDKLFDRVRIISGYMAKAEGFTPLHLIGKTEACFAVVTRALTWKLDPFAVAQATYSPSKGKVGFQGNLCQAIIENSGMVVGGVTFEPYGDWSKVHGKFEKRESKKTDQEGNVKSYLAATYTTKDEEGLGVIARAQVKGEKSPREFKIDLRQAHPRNSTLWATDPLTQLKYRAARGLGNLAMPGIFMGVPFDPEDNEPAHLSRHPVIDVNPVATAAELNETYLGNTATGETAASAPEPQVAEKEAEVVVIPVETVEQVAARKPTASEIVAQTHAELEVTETEKKTPAPAEKEQPIVLNASTNYGLMTGEKLKQAVRQVLEDLKEYAGDADAIAGYWASINGKVLAFALGRKGLSAEKAKLEAVVPATPKP